MKKFDDPPKKIKVKKRRYTKAKSNHFVKLKELQCFDEIHKRIIAGWPTTQIADFIQNEQGEYTDVARESLTRTLRKYRDAVARGDLLKTRMPDRVIELAQEAEDALDEVKELAKLYQIQMSRIQAEAKLENNIGKLFKTLGNEVFYAMKILQTSAQVKKDFGLSPEGSEDTEQSQTGNTVNILSMDFSSKYGSENVQKVLEDPASRRKVLSLYENLAKIPDDKKRDMLGGKPEMVIEVPVEEGED